MSIADTIAADQTAVAAAQAALDAAQEALDASTSQLAVDQAALDALAPHVGLWSEIESYASTLGTVAEAIIKGFSDRAKSLLGL